MLWQFSQQVAAVRRMNALIAKPVRRQVSTGHNVSTGWRDE